MSNRRWGWFVAGFGLSTSLVVAGCGGSSTTLGAPSAGGSAGEAGTGLTHAGSGGASDGGSAAGMGAGAGDGNAGASGSGNSAGAGGASGDAGRGGTLGDAGHAGAAGAAGGGGHAGSVGGAGHSGSGGSAGGVSNDFFGLTCAADIDCSDGLTCLLPNDPRLVAGGPANGLCTLACLTSSDCTQVAPDAGCVDFGGGAAYCFQGCAPGEPVDINAKCHGRADMACDSYSAGSVFLCTPLCRADVECGSGRFCDPKSGLCVATKPSGDPVGTPCDPTAAANNCLGICLITSPVGVVPETGECAQLCSYGENCMYTGSSPGGVCAGALSQTTGSLDLGYCEPSCNCDATCKFGDICQAFTASDATVQASLGTAGFCYPNAIGSTELTTCQ